MRSATLSSPPFSDISSNGRRSEDPYAVLTAAFATVVAGFVASRRSRLPERISMWDVAQIGLASFGLARVVARDKIAVFVRRPFTSGEAAQQPAGEGIPRAIGELLTCPHCLALWLSGAFTCGLVALPRETRFVTSIFAGHLVGDAATRALGRFSR